MKQSGINHRKWTQFIVLVCNIFMLLCNASLIKYYILIIIMVVPMWLCQFYVCEEILLINYIIFIFGCYLLILNIEKQFKKVM